MDEERHDVAELGVVLVLVVRQNRDAIVHVVGKADHLVVEENHVLAPKVAVGYHPEILDEAVVELGAALPCDHV